MDIDLERLANRSMTYAITGAVAVVIGWVIAAQSEAGAGLIFGWAVVGVGTLTIQAAIVGWLIAGSSYGSRPGDHGVVMDD